MSDIPNRGTERAAPKGVPIRGVANASLGGVPPGVLPDAGAGKFAEAFWGLHDLAARFGEISCAIAGVSRPEAREERAQRFPLERERNEAALQIALKEIFGAEGFPENLPNYEVLWRHDGWGRPFVNWRGAALDWANGRGYSDQHLRVSNTHDGAAHLVLAAYGENLVGAGVDVVYLPRLRGQDKGRDYLLRFARQFMSGQEWDEFSKHAQKDSDEELTVRAAAHFSLMEAASKACGTGLKIGFGMGRDYSLPKDSLAVTDLHGEVKTRFHGAAQDRIEQLGATRCEANWSVCDEANDYLVSAVLLFRT